jgi:hypothetical protein
MNRVMADISPSSVLEYAVILVGFALVLCDWAARSAPKPVWLQCLPGLDLP